VRSTYDTAVLLRNFAGNSGRKVDRGAAGDSGFEDFEVGVFRLGAKQADDGGDIGGGGGDDQQPGSGATEGDT
jgi:hypothetical protein